MLKYLGILSLFNILHEKRTASNKCDKLISNIFLSHYHLLKPASHTVFTSFRKINRRCNFTWQGVTESLLTSQNQYKTPPKPLLKEII